MLRSLFCASCFSLCISLFTSLGSAEEIVVEKRTRIAEWRFDATVVPPTTAQRILAPTYAVVAPMQITQVASHGSKTTDTTVLLQFFYPSGAASTQPTVKAPGKGTFYHGYHSAGRWVTSTRNLLLEPGISVAMGEPLGTWVPDGAQSQLVAAVPSQSLSGMELGVTGVALFQSKQLHAVPVLVKQLSDIPLPDGSREVHLDFTGPLPLESSPGMVVPIRLAVKRPSAIVLPVRALRWSSETWFVSIRLADGKSAPRPVQLGLMVSDQVEITSGLEVGQVVVVPGLVQTPHE